MWSRLSSSRRAAVVALVALVAVNVLTFGLVAAVPGLSVFRPESSPPAVAAPVPVGPAEPALPVLESVPASEMLSRVSAPLASVLPGWTVSVSDSRRHGTPFSYACGSSLDAGSGAMFVSTSRFRSGSDTASVQFWVLGAGQGAAAFEELYAGLRSCPSRDATAPRLSLRDDLGAEALFASMSRSGEGVSWLLWRQGDVLASVAFSSLGGPPSVSRVSGVAERVDALLRPELSECVVLDAPVSAAARSPYGLVEFSPLTRSVPVRAPVAEVFPEVPWEVPAVTVFDPSRGSAALSPPAGAVTSRPSAPVLVEPHPGVGAARLQVSDELGPGCGWAFTGMVPPVVDLVAVERSSPEVFRSAQFALASDAFDEFFASARRQLLLREYLLASSSFESYRSYLVAYRAAVASEEAERRRLEELEERRLEELRSEEERRLAEERAEQDEDEVVEFPGEPVGPPADPSAPPADPSDSPSGPGSPEVPAPSASPSPAGSSSGAGGS